MILTALALITMAHVQTARWDPPERGEIQDHITSSPNAPQMPAIVSHEKAQLLNSFKIFLGNADEVSKLVPFTLIYSPAIQLRLAFAPPHGCPSGSTEHQLGEECPRPVVRRPMQNSFRRKSGKLSA